MRLLVIVGLVTVLGIGACRFFWPEHLAVNAPLRQMLLGRGIATPSEEELQTRLQVPEGFSVGLYAGGLPNARFLRFTDEGELLVSTPRSGRIHLLSPDADGDGRSDAQRVLLEGLEKPHGLELHDGWLYVALGSSVGRIRLEVARNQPGGSLEPVITDLPSGGNHWTRTVRFGNDGRIYVSVGSSCNVCVEKDPRRAAILSYRADGSGEQIYAAGLRNSVGFDWQPGTGDLYATDNGRDLLGDDVPPCELNRVVENGFYGWPFAHGDRVPDPDFGTGQDAKIAGSIPPSHAFRAHTAPLGITFVRRASAPPTLRNAALVALHGSWNRTRKDGYEVVSLHWLEDGRIEERPFLSGFLEDDAVIGRPVDVAEGPDGAFYVSDDYAGAIYRVVWGASSGTPAPLTDATPEHASRPSTQSTPEDVLAGNALYEAHACARCHDPERVEAGAIAVALEALAARYTPLDLAAFLAAPTPPMPLFPLDEAERLQLAAYLLQEF